MMQRDSALDSTLNVEDVLTLIQIYLRLVEPGLNSSEL